jgi:hypothetical protein
MAPSGGGGESTMSDRDDVDFIDLGQSEFILRCEVARDLQRLYDVARTRYLRDRGAGALRELQSVQNEIRRSRPDDIIKSAALPELRKVAGRTRVECTVDEADFLLRHRAHAGAMRHKHPNRLADCATIRKADIQIARIAGIPVDMSKVPERIRVLYARAVAMGENGATEAQRQEQAGIMREIALELAAFRLLNDALVEGGNLRTEAADIHHRLSWPRHAAGV